MNSKKLMYGKNPLAPFLFASMLFFVSSYASGASYTFRDLGTIDGSESGAYAINAIGEIVGYSSISANSNETHATLWNDTGIKDLGAFENGFYGSRAADINNAGDIVGTSDGHPDSDHPSDGNLSDYGTHAAIWKNRTLTELQHLKGYSNANAINDSGQIVGSSYFTSGPGSGSHATFWNGTTRTDLGTLGGTLSDASDINDSGQIVGWSYIADNTAQRPTAWVNNKPVDLGTLGGPSGQAVAINDAGQIVGYRSTADRVSHATLWDGTTTTSLGSMAGGTETGALDINNSGQIVGFTALGVENHTTIVHATLWNDPDTPIDLNSFLDASTRNEGWVLFNAYGINDSGSIVGQVINTKHPDLVHAFVLSPIPEPEIYALLLAGLGLLGFIKRRRNTFLGL